MYQNVTERQSIFLDKKLSLTARFYYLEPGPYFFIRDSFEAMNLLNQERRNYSESCMTLEMSPKT